MIDVLTSVGNPSPQALPEAAAFQQKKVKFCGGGAKALFAAIVLFRLSRFGFLFLGALGAVGSARNFAPFGSFVTFSHFSFPLLLVDRNKYGSVDSVIGLSRLIGPCLINWIRHLTASAKSEIYWEHTVSYTHLTLPTKRIV